MRPWPLLVLLAGCSPRERPFVAAASPPNPAAGRLVMKADGAFAGLEACTAEVLIDAPARIRMGDFGKALGPAIEGGAKEIAVLVDTPAGEGAVPLPLPAEPPGVSVWRQGKLVSLWAVGESPDLPCVRVAPGFDGAWSVVETGPVKAFLDGGPADPAPAASIDGARFVILWTSREDLLKDVVLSLLALERRFPGKVVLETSRH